MAQTSLFTRKGASILYHREVKAERCPCLTPEGNRNPEWHKAHPGSPECNAEGFLFESNNHLFQGFIMPAFTGRRMSLVLQTFGAVEVDDHIGIFPLYANDSTALRFDNWSQTGDDYVEWEGYRFLVAGFSLVPDPANAALLHHWECLLKRINQTPYGQPPVGAY